MTEILLKQRQIYSMKRLSLEERFSKFHEKHQDDAYIIQCAVAVMLRNSLSIADFSFLAKELICSILLKSHSLASVRHLSPYFENYFSKKDWHKVKDNLFANEEEYLTLTEKTRLNIEILLPLLHSGKCPVEKKHNLKAAFEDENGKLHTWSLSNVVRRLDPLQTHALLSILGELTIFQKDGVRRFTRVVWLDYAVAEKHRSFDIRKEEDPLYQPKKTQPEEPEEMEPFEATAPADAAATKERQDPDEARSANASTLEQFAKKVLTDYPQETPLETADSSDSPTEDPPSHPKNKPKLAKTLYDHLTKLRNNGQQPRKKRDTRNKNGKNKNKGKKWK